METTSCDVIPLGLFILRIPSIKNLTHNLKPATYNNYLLVSVVS